MIDYIHELRKITGPRKLILNCAGALIIQTLAKKGMHGIPHALF